MHRETDAKICCQIGHSGRKGSTQLGWQEMDAPLADENWELVSASPIAWSKHNATPREITRAEMDEIKDQFVAATEMSDRAGFDMIEVHAAHGICFHRLSRPCPTSVRTSSVEVWKIVCAIHSMCSERC